MKEENSKDISQFRNIALLNIEGKIIVSVLARRMTYLLENSYINIIHQRVSSCIELVSRVHKPLYDPEPKQEKTRSGLILPLHMDWSHIN